MYQTIHHRATQSISLGEEPMVTANVGSDRRAEKKFPRHEEALAQARAAVGKYLQMFFERRVGRGSGFSPTFRQARIEYLRNFIFQS